MRVRPALIVLTAIVVAVVAGSSLLQRTSNSSAAPATTTKKAEATTVAEPVKDVPLLTLPDPLPTRTVRVPILMYHRIAVLAGDEPAVTVDLTVDPGEFALEMQWLKDNGYTSITQIDHADTALQRTRRRPASARQASPDYLR
ncbi:MAG: hypothetical protein NTZ81_08250 [Actinobacteria bacterium]|nr:hypothetical protein [Actinomycetota bacterium]